MYCRHCGKEIKDDSKICPECGEKIDQIPHPSVLESDAGESRKTDKKYQNEKKLGIVLVVIWIVFIIGTVVFAVVDRNISDENEKTIEETETTEESTEEASASTEESATKETTVAEETKESESSSQAQEVSFLESLILDGEKRIYTDEELINRSDYELMILRNGMYALSGKIFTKNQEVIDFFKNCTWYMPDEEDEDIVYDRMNDYQKGNLDKIIQVEKTRKELNEGSDIESSDIYAGYIGTWRNDEGEMPIVLEVTDASGNPGETGRFSAVINDGWVVFDGCMIDAYGEVAMEYGDDGYGNFGLITLILSGENIVVYVDELYQNPSETFGLRMLDGIILRR